MTSRRRVYPALLVAAGAAGWSPADSALDRGVMRSAVGRRAPMMCSFAAPGVIRLRSRTAVAFIGTGTADTVLAGPGLTRYTTERGHTGPGKDRPIYGQVAHVARFERSAPQPFQEAMAGGDRSVVLVPWDYGADCGRVPWNSSARWLLPGAGGAFVARLRDRAYWAGGRPTFDVTPALAIYPPSANPWSMRPSRDREVTADEFLTLYELMPDLETLLAVPDSAMSPLVRWAQTNPERASRLPIVPLLSFMRWELRMRRYKSRASPIAGTYRIVYRTTAGDSSVFFARTELNPTSIHLSERVARADSAELDDRHPIGHTLLAEIAPTLGELPRHRRLATNRGAVHGYLQVVDSALAAAGPTPALPGSLDLDGQAIRFAPDSSVAAALRQAVVPRTATRRAFWDRRQPAVLGRFTLGSDGRLRYRELVVRDGVPVLAISADRISRDHYPPTLAP